jgi:SAM-dependent methyltransferase
MRRFQALAGMTVQSRELEGRETIRSAEPERVRKVFEERKEPGGGLFDAFRLQTHQERYEQLLVFFREARLSSLENLRVLDVGCGSGGHLRRMADFGVDPANCFGVDLFRNSLCGARRLNPNIHFFEANAAQLPFGNDAFDLVFQYTMLTSVLDSELRREIVSEIQRVLRPGGYFIWYDFAYSNPKNPNVRGIGRREIRQLLGGFQVRLRRVTLAPPIGRPAARIAPLLYRTLAAVPLLRSHYYCFAQNRKRR